jgi:hypothetical protein
MSTLYITIEELMKVLGKVKNKFGNLKVSTGIPGVFMMLNGKYVSVQDGFITETNQFYNNYRFYKEKNDDNFSTYIEENGLNTNIHEYSFHQNDDDFQICLKKYGKVERVLCLCNVMSYEMTFKRMF